MLACASSNRGDPVLFATLKGDQAIDWEQDRIKVRLSCLAKASQLVEMLQLRRCPIDLFVDGMTTYRSVAQPTARAVFLLRVKRWVDRYAWADHRHCAVGLTAFALRNRGDVAFLAQLPA